MFSQGTHRCWPVLPLTRIPCWGCPILDQPNPKPQSKPRGRLRTKKKTQSKTSRVSSPSASNQLTGLGSKGNQPTPIPFNNSRGLVAGNDGRKNPTLPFAPRNQKKTANQLDRTSEDARSTWWTSQKCSADGKTMSELPTRPNKTLSLCPLQAGSCL